MCVSATKSLHSAEYINKPWNSEGPDHCEEQTETPRADG